MTRASALGALLLIAGCSDLSVDLGGLLAGEPDSGSDAGVSDGGHDMSDTDAGSDASDAGRDSSVALDAGSDAGDAMDATVDMDADVDADMDADMDADVPDPVVTGTVVHVVAGTQSACATLSDTRVACWGRNDYGQLALAPRSHATCVACEPKPREVPALEGATAIALGTRHGCALFDGDVKCWGSNVFGELGLGTSDLLIHATPHKVALANVVQLVAGRGFTCARDDAGKIHCWGLAQRGSLGVSAGTLPTCKAPFDEIEGVGLEGRATGVACSKAPLEITALGTTKKVAAGSFHACAIDSGDNLLCWGSNLRGEIGVGVPSIAQLPTQVLTGVADVALGFTHTCAVQAGALSCWGQSVFGQLGLMTTSLVTSPMSTPTAGTVLAVGCGEASTCVIDSTQVVRCTGANESNQLGIAGPDTCTINSLTTACSRGFIVTGLPTMIDELAIGSAYGCGRTGSTVHCWGDNTYGQLGVTGVDSSLTAVTTLGP